MRNFERAQQQTDQRFRSMEQRAKKAGERMETSFAAVSTRINAGLKGIGTGFLAGVSLQGAQRLIDTATKIQNALKVAGLSGEDLTKVYDALFASAQKNAVPLEALVQLYGRAAQQQRELGVSSGQLLQFTDNVALALRVAGTDAGQASGALLQLGQALGSGTVHAEEFNSVLEGAPTIAQAAAAGLKEAGGSV
ncbi:phage tail tape measure protein, partial [Mesorhizobium sp. M2A.F.Ca.ET.046.02.1.1]